MSQSNIARYDSYKDSEIELLGHIPAHWNIMRIKEKGSVKARVGWKALKASEYVDDGYAFLSTPNIKNKDIDFRNVNYITYQRYIESPEIMLEEDDILLAKDGSTLGIVNIVTYLPKEATVNSSIAVLRFGKTIFNKYLFYQIKSKYIQDNIMLKKSGMGVPHLFQQDINNFIIIVPPLPEQTAIAAYLDDKTSKIDRQVELLSQKAAQYDSLKQSLINETVIQGLDKSAPMKDSGFEWIGEVPTHWDLVRLKEISEINRNTLSENTPAGYEFNYVDISSVSYGVRGYITEKTSYADAPSRARRLVKSGDTIISTVRTYLKAVTTIEDAADIVVSTGFAVISPKTGISKKFLSYLLVSEVMINRVSAISKGVSYPATNATEIGDLFCFLPSQNEQVQIAEYLDEKSSKIVVIIETINKQIEKLKELRKTLINDVVTGKINVVEESVPA